MHVAYFYVQQKLAGETVRLHYIGDEEPFRRQLLGHLKGNAPDICDIGDYPLAQEVQKSYSWHLSRLINAWIETGRNGALKEDPRRRTLYKDDWLRGIVERWAADNQAEIEFNTIKCELVVHFPGQQFLDETRPALAKQAAVGRFVTFLDSNDKFLLCRCRHYRCERYYYLRRMVRDPIEYGTYCPAHRQIASAERSKKNNRNLLKSRLVEFAADALNKVPDRYRRNSSDGKAKAWIATKVTENVRKSKALRDRCRRMGFVDPQTREVRIKNTWVTRHWEGITAEAERRARAKG